MKALSHRKMIPLFMGLVVAGCSHLGLLDSVTVKVVDEGGNPIKGALAVPAPPFFQNRSNSKGRLSFSSAGGIIADGYEQFVISDEMLENKSSLHGKTFILKRSSE